ncbi:DUF4258 domain-containing protein [Candidatus Aerophobetes bacterium]|nr:DUF4258 domain-containing protein [Candidatus Aerophobetes bacterium]
MNTEEELISKDEIRQVIFEGEIVEDYPEDKRGHSCLMFTYTSVGRPVHLYPLNPPPIQALQKS